MVVSQFFILSARGDTIISKECRGDAIKGASEILFRKVKFYEQGDCPPAFNVDKVNYIHIRKNGLLFGATSRFNVSPSTIIEMLNRITKVCKDYCGVLSEEAIRKNFILIYELIDEMMDYGYPQVTSTENLKAFVYNEPILVEASKPNLRLPQGITASNRTAPSAAVHKPVLQNGQKNEIFVDILEKLNVLFSPNGYIVNSNIDGSIQMKSYLSGSPELRLALNSDLIIGRENGAGAGYGAVVLDDCNFHECCRLDEFDQTRTLSFYPPDGEFTLLNYRVTTEFRTPFRIFPHVEQTDPLKIECNITVRADIPESNYGANVILQIPMPRNAASVIAELPSGSVGQRCEYNSTDKKVIWEIKKFPGTTEKNIRIRINLNKGSAVSSNARKEIGPIAMTFEIPMYNVSNVQVRYLRISEQHKSYNPYRWVRYVTQASSYVSRV